MRNPYNGKATGGHRLEVTAVVGKVTYRPKRHLTMHTDEHFQWVRERLTAHPDHTDLDVARVFRRTFDLYMGAGSVHRIRLEMAS